MKNVTARERQILQWIRENPLISQEELARKAGITRSGASVHISNLIKKGLILGKGYVVSRPQPVTVVGAINVDIKATPSVSLRQSDSNPGKISVCAGGVGFNIACNLALLGVPVHFISVFGGGTYASMLKQKCLECGIDISASLTVESEVSSSYVCINDNLGDMFMAVSDMDIYAHLSRSYMETKLPLIDKSALCIVDTNIPAETIEVLANRSRVPIIAEPVSAHKAVKLLPVLHKLFAVTPNKLEARVLCDGAPFLPSESFSSKKDLMSEAKEYASFLLNKGVQRAYISLGAEGLFCADKAERLTIPSFMSEGKFIKNTTGAGDSQTAAIAWSILKNMSLRESAKAGIAAASLCLETEEAVNENISEGVLYERIREIP